jgi:hypothetical protein
VTPRAVRRLEEQVMVQNQAYYLTITYYWTVPLIMDHSNLVESLKNSKIAETKPLEPLKY